VTPAKGLVRRVPLASLGWLAAAVVAMCACAPPPGAGSIGIGGRDVISWPMDETQGTVMRDATGSGLDGRIGSAISMGGGTFGFPGWTQNVDAAGRLVGAVSPDAGAVTVPDPDDRLDPSTGSFAVSLRLRSALTPRGGLPVSGRASYNIVQKARADDPGGFWKLELEGSGPTSGQLRWVLSDGRQTVVVTSGRRVDDGAWHDVTAERRAGQSVLTVDGVAATASTTRLGVIGPRGPYSAAMTVGKKPGSADPGDAFAGWLDALTVQRST
jgi:hypothetical protein